jgi:hypothetical protein
MRKKIRGNKGKQKFCQENLALPFSVFLKREAQGRETPDAILQRGVIFQFSLPDNFDPGLRFSNI